MKRNILYIGNYLHKTGGNPTYMNVLGELLEDEDFNVRYTSSKKNQFFRYFSMLWACLEYRKTTDYVLIDVYSTLNFYYALGVSQFCRILGLPYIPILHGGNLEHRLKNNPRFCNLIFKNARCLISPSLFLKNIFNEYAYENVKFIPNALPLASYCYKERTIDTVRMLWVRSFSKIYNPLLALKVLKSLQLEGYEASLCMVGPDSDGTLGHALAMAKELNIEVKFMGKLSKEEWHNLSKNYNVFINTTQIDNMPVSVVEAMALGLPIVSTNVGGIPYLIEHEKEGLLVSPNNEFEIADAIKRLKNQPVFTKALIFNARSKVEKYDWKIIKLEWLKILS